MLNSVSKFFSVKKPSIYNKIKKYDSWTYVRQKLKYAESVISMSMIDYRQWYLSRLSDGICAGLRLASVDCYDAISNAHSDIERKVGSDILFKECVAFTHASYLLRLNVNSENFGRIESSFDTFAKEISLQCDDKDGDIIERIARYMEYDKSETPEEAISAEMSRILSLRSKVKLSDSTDIPADYPVDLRIMLSLLNVLESSKKVSNLIFGLWYDAYTEYAGV